MSIQKLSAIISSRIRTLRNSRGWSQSKLASQINIHPTYISRIESCQKLPTLNIIASIADAFGIKYYELFVDPYEVDKSDYCRKKIFNIVKESAPFKVKFYSALIDTVHKEFQKIKD